MLVENFDELQEALAEIAVVALLGSRPRHEAGRRARRQGLPAGQRLELLRHGVRRPARSRTATAGWSPGSRRGRRRRASRGRRRPRRSAASRAASTSAGCRRPSRSRARSCSTEPIPNRATRSSRRSACLRRSPAAIAGASASVTVSGLAVNQDATCTFSNRRTSGELTVVKVFEGTPVKVAADRRRREEDRQHADLHHGARRRPARAPPGLRGRSTIPTSPRSTTARTCAPRAGVTVAGGRRDRGRGRRGRRRRRQR